VIISGTHYRSFSAASWLRRARRREDKGSPSLAVNFVRTLRQASLAQYWFRLISRGQVLGIANVREFRRCSIAVLYLILFTHSFLIGQCRRGTSKTPVQRTSPRRHLLKFPPELIPSLYPCSGGLVRKVFARNDLFGLGGYCCIDELDCVVETRASEEKPARHS
jgi:hypothetical protein